MDIIKNWEGKRSFRDEVFKEILDDHNHSFDNFWNGEFLY